MDFKADDDYVHEEFDENDLEDIGDNIRPSSSKQLKASTKKFNEFLQKDYRNHGLPNENITLADLIEEMFSDVNFVKKLLGRYGSYLFKHGKISFKTADQYLSAIKCFICNIFPFRSSAIFTTIIMIFTITIYNSHKYTQYYI